MKDIILLNRNNCKNCYKCIRHCPVKSIHFSGDKAHVIEDACILCGQCYEVCPQGAKEVTSDFEKVMVMLQQQEKIVLSIAPSYVAYFDHLNITTLRAASKKMGFMDCQETSIGAAYVTQAYEHYIESNQPRHFITSACHSVNLLIQKHFPELIPFLAPIMSPMQAHGYLIKQVYPDAKVVFVGPCIAKIDEARDDDSSVDAVLSYSEFAELLESVDMDYIEDEEDVDVSPLRLYPVSGGIIHSMTKRDPAYTYITIDGREKCIEALHELKSDFDHRYVIEMSMCEGSCIDGPFMKDQKKNPLKRHTHVVTQKQSRTELSIEKIGFSLEKTFKPYRHSDVMPTKQEIEQVLKSMGKTDKSQELNCGSCGYHTCYDKAVAVCQGKANLSMCLPFLKERAEHFYQKVLDYTPLGIIVLNEYLEIQQINDAARSIMQLSKHISVSGEHISHFFDEAPFVKALEQKRSFYCVKKYVSQYQKHIECSLIYDHDFHIMMYMMKDLTEKIHREEIKEAHKTKTIEVTNQVVEKQMRIVQEIASLLGETAAETKLAITKLKEYIEHE